MDFADLFLVLKPGDPQGPYETLANAQEAGAVTVNYGTFINNVLIFLIVAVATFILVRGMNRLYMQAQKEEEKPEEAPTTKTCDYCKETIPIEAVRCPHCTSHLEAATA